jgi:AcrR family transcriptional regulator
VSSYREATRRLLRQTLLDAARGLLGERPWAQITMAEIASRAGVSRQTLYNELGGRDQFAQAFVIREAERFIETVEAAIERHLDDPAAALAAALHAFLHSASEDPLIGMLRQDDGTGGMLPLITTRSRPVLDWATQRIAAAIARGWPLVAERDAALLSEAIVRLAISYVTVPVGPPQHAVQDAVRLLQPFIERAVVSVPR